MKEKYWLGTIDKCDICQVPITGGQFVDGKTRQGPWANMCMSCWDRYGIGGFGTGLGQKYELQQNGKWLKVAG